MSYVEQDWIFRCLITLLGSIVFIEALSILAFHLPLVSFNCTFTISALLLLLFRCLFQTNYSLLASEMQIASEPSKVGEAESLPSLSGDCSLEVESGASKRSNGKIITSLKDSCCDNDGDVTDIQNALVERQHACEPTINHETCSTSGCHQSSITMSLQKSKSRRAGERGKRKRWRGRSGDLSYFSDMFYDGSTKTHLCTAASSAGTNKLEENEVILVFCNMLNVYSVVVLC